MCQTLNPQEKKTSNTLKAAKFLAKNTVLATFEHAYLGRLLPDLLEWECEFPHPPPLPGSLDSPQLSNDFPQADVLLSTEGSEGPLLRVHVAGTGM